MPKDLSVVEYAKKYNLCRQTVYTYIGDGRIPKKNVTIIPRPVIRIKDEAPLEKEIKE